VPWYIHFLVWLCGVAFLYPIYSKNNRKLDEIANFNSALLALVWPLSLPMWVVRHLSLNLLSDKESSTTSCPTCKDYI